MQDLDARYEMIRNLKVGDRVWVDHNIIRGSRHLVTVVKVTNTEIHTDRSGDVYRRAWPKGSRKTWIGGRVGFGGDSIVALATSQEYADWLAKKEEEISKRDARKQAEESKENLRQELTQAFRGENVAVDHSYREDGSWSVKLFGLSEAEVRALALTLNGSLFLKQDTPSDE